MPKNIWIDTKIVQICHFYIFYRWSHGGRRPSWILGFWRKCSRVPVWHSSDFDSAPQNLLQTAKKITRYKNRGSDKKQVYLSNYHWVVTIQSSSTVFELIIRDSLTCIFEKDRINRNVIFAAPLTLKPILIDCICFGAARQRYLAVDILKELFENVESRNIVAFLNIETFIITGGTVVQALC